MRRLMTILVLTLAMAWPAKADEAAIRDVITRQIEAFKLDDFDTAFTFASPTIQNIFRTPENFGVMVRQGYPMVWRPADVEFLGAEIIAGELWQKVLIRDGAGAFHLLGYQMEQGENGWKINAVQLLDLPQGMA